MLVLQTIGNFVGHVFTPYKGRGAQVGPIVSCSNPVIFFYLFKSRGFSGINPFQSFLQPGICGFLFRGFPAGLFFYFAGRLWRNMLQDFRRFRSF
jgi:hypothetical protein